MSIRDKIVWEYIQACKAPAGLCGNYKPTADNGCRTCGERFADTILAIEVEGEPLIHEHCPAFNECDTEATPKDEALCNMHDKHCYRDRPVTITDLLTRVEQ